VSVQDIHRSRGPLAGERPRVARVAVVMAAYNAERTLPLAVDSVLQGTLPCRLFIVDDCSTLPVQQVLADLAADQVEIIRLDRNVGAAAARNVAIERIVRDGYDFIAIMDADDICHRERLARQVAFLETHPDIGLVGSWLRLIDDQSGAVVRNVELPHDPLSIRHCLPLKLCVPHPTWLARTVVFTTVGLYDPQYRAAEDYELLRRIDARFNIANLPEYLLDYRLSAGGITTRHRAREFINRVRIQLRYFQPGNWRCWAGVLRTLALLAAHMVRIPLGTAASVAAAQPSVATADARSERVPRRQLGR
jgi:glycosyltransferase involved in cell wall biosynthesis